jgi:hypothetical protein
MVEHQPLGENDTHDFLIGQCHDDGDGSISTGSYGAAFEEQDLPSVVAFLDSDQPELVITNQWHNPITLSRDGDVVTLSASDMEDDIVLTKRQQLLLAGFW